MLSKVLAYDSGDKCTKTAQKHRKRNDITLISTRVRVQDSLSDVKN